MTVGAANLPYGFDEDSILVRRFLSGDEAAFDGIYQRYHDRVFALARGILLHEEEAHDAVQEAFALIYRNLGRFGGRSKLGTWIFRIAVNTSIQHARRTKSRKLETHLDETLVAATRDTDGVDEPRVHAALSKLTPSDRAALTMFYWEDLPLTEIGEALQCGAGAAKTRLHRARERFRAAYEAIGDQP